MELPSLLDRATPSDVHLAPFPHLVVRDALEHDLYGELAAQFPPLDVMSGDRPTPAKGKCFLPARDSLDHPQVSRLWREFVSLHVSRDFFRQVVALLGDHIRKLHPDLERNLGSKLEDLQTSVRFREAPREAVLECQFVHGAGSSEPKSFIGPHLDRALALYAGLFYLRLDEDDSTGGDLELYRYRKPSRPLHATRRVPEEAVEKVKTIPYRANTLVLFPHSPDSVHAVSVRSATPVPRLHINLVAEFGFPIYDVRQSHEIVPEP